MSFSDKIFGSYTKRNKKKVQSIVHETEALEEEYAKITNSQKKRKVKIKYIDSETKMPYYEEKIFTEEEFEFYKITSELRRELRNGKTINDIMPKALAVCREASRRSIGIFQYPVQLEAAIAMQDNVIAEMKTGEGKTFVQTLSAYLNALEATKSLDKKEWKSVHVLTANDYLAARDKEQNEKVYGLLGLTTGYGIPQADINSGKRTREEKRREYDSDIVYATPKTVAFDYLDDNHAYNESDLFLRRPLHKAIVDEADDILLDQAIRPLVLSRGTSKSDKIDLYEWATRFINGEPGYRSKKIECAKFGQYYQKKYDVWKREGEKGGTIYCDAAFYEDTQQIDLSEDLEKEIFLNSPSLRRIKRKYDTVDIRTAIVQCLYARESIKKGKQYQVFEDEKETKKSKVNTVLKVVLTDHSTGRSMESTTYSNGLQEAIEAKESYLLEKEQKGVKGRRKILKYSNQNEIIGKCTYPDFLKIYEGGVCGMTGTSDIDEFHDIYGLNTYEVPSRLPNIRKDESDELYATERHKHMAILKEILKCQKTLQPVLIGTTCVSESDKLCELLDKYGIRYQRLDAVNSSNEDGIKKTAGLLGMVTVATNMAGRGIDIQLGEGVEEVGGLYVIGSSKNSNIRIDNQLRGRAARQGQPGRTKYFMSLDDELVRVRFPNGGLERYKETYSTGTGRIKLKSLLKFVNNCQLSEEGIRAQERKQSEIIEERVFTRHKNIIYNERQKVLKADDEKLKTIISRTFITYVDDLFKEFDQEKISTALGHLVDIRSCFDHDRDKYKENIINSLNKSFDQVLKNNPNYYKTVKTNILKSMDDYWVLHMYTLEDIWKTCTWYSYSSVDPLEMYTRESTQSLMGLIYYIKNELITYSLHPEYKYGDYVPSGIIMKNEENKNNIDINANNIQDLDVDTSELGDGGMAAAI